MKVIAFDLIGVLVQEIEYPLNDVQQRMERLFGKDENDLQYVRAVQETISNEIDVEKNIAYIINHIYQVKDPLLFEKIKKLTNAKIIIATNHVSYIREYIVTHFDMNLIDCLYISADINLVKPNRNFFEYILQDLSIKPDELLFFDDNSENVDSALELGIATIKVNKNTDILKEIKNQIDVL